MTRIDAHQHFWDLTRFEYKWMYPHRLSKLHQNYLPERLAPILSQNRFDGTVVVQADTVTAETQWLLELAARHEFIRAVVGWVDLTDPNLGSTLDELQRDPKFKGVRHPAHDEPDDNWLLREDVLQGLTELARRGLPFDLLLRPKHLKLVPQLAERVPELRMVIDHIAKPPIAKRLLKGWADDIQAAAASPQVYCKLSGMITEANLTGWTADDLRPFVMHVMKVFGPQRLMFGSDWPVCILAGSWKEVLAAFTQAIGPQLEPARERLLGGTAMEFYRIEAGG